jgi:uncharacterized Zn finger protein
VTAAPRYRCTSCGNLTRFDVTSARRTRAFHHYTVSGELSVEQEEVLEETIEAVVCRWCGPSGSVTVEVAAGEVVGE